uniref:Uncharacterized protein LOC107457911 n=1 Tax=Rhizophora mucronata TaxID=61149 RepID=A0A2P2MW41_RHIMU
MHTPAGLGLNLFFVLNLPTYPVPPRNQAPVVLSIHIPRVENIS